MQYSPQLRDESATRDWLDRYGLPAVIVLAVLIRLFYAIPGIGEPQILMRPDSPTYLNPAESILCDGRYASGPGGELTAFRTPLYPLYLAFCLFVSHHNLSFCVIVSCILGGLTVLPVYLSARLYGNRKTSFFAALLYALNPTAVALSPMFLSDTLFMAVFGWQMLFFLKFIRSPKITLFLVSVFLAAAGALIRPVNMLWIFPCLVVFWWIREIPWRKKVCHTFSALAVFCVVLMPWMVRNERAGFGFRLDSSDVQALTHSVSTMMSIKTGRPPEFIRNCYQIIWETKAVLEPEKFKTPADMSHFQTSVLMKEIKKEPILYLSLHFRPVILLPDIPYFLENLKLTATGRGTFSVLNQHGIIAAVNHYFNGNYKLMILLPLLVLIPLATYYMAFRYLFSRIRKRNDWMLVLLFLLLAEYYLFLPGPVAMPRYQLPAVAFFCVLAGAWLSERRNTNQIA